MLELSKKETHADPDLLRALALSRDHALHGALALAAFAVVDAQHARHTDRHAPGADESATRGLPAPRTPPTCPRAP